MYLVSDLDHTLIYSHQNTGLCVEYLDGRPLSFMTRRARSVLKQLSNHNCFHLIPCTLRSFEQTSRVEFIKEGLATTVICDNGYSIYNHGILDRQWDDKMRELIHLDCNLELYQQLIESIKLYNIPVNQVKSNRDAFYTVIFPDVETADNHTMEILRSTIHNDFQVTQQGRKLYFIPKILNKSLAFAYLKAQHPNELFVAAGDSEIDIDFVKLSDCPILPRHASIRFNEAHITHHGGMEAGEDILNSCLEMLS